MASGLGGSKIGQFIKQKKPNIKNNVGLGGGVRITVHSWGVKKWCARGGAGWNTNEKEEEEGQKA